MPKDKKTNTIKKKKLNRKRLALFIVITTFLCFFAIGTGVVLASISDVPAFDPKNLDTNASTILYDKDGNEFARVHGSENRIPVKIDQIPKQVQDTFIAIEDVRFYQHHGVSLRDIFRAIYIDITSQKKEQGASTITQQLAKMTFLKPDKTIKRKIQEVYLALQIEHQYTKQEILEMYLNRIYFGEGAYGIQAAAQTYYNKNVDQLTLSEAATLASIPKSPTYFDPYRNPANNKDRRNLVLANMDKYGFAKHADVEKAKNEELKLNFKGNSALIKYDHPYFVEYVINQLLDNNYTEDAIYKGGLKVYTTLDPKIQTSAEQVLADEKNFKDFKAVSFVDKDKNKQPQASAIITDQHTGYIKALVGGRDHNGLRVLNRANTKRQTGSAIKPILDYGPAIENGDSPATPVDDSPLSFPWKVNGENWEPKDEDPPMGVVSYRTALTVSANIPAIEVLQKVGLNNAISFAKKLGVTSIREKDANLSYALGTETVSPVEMAGAYGAFGNNGVYVQPTAVLKVMDKNGNTTDWTKKQDKHVAMKETTAYLMTSMLESVVTGGTGANAQVPGWQVAGKTGTTEEHKDLWFAGYTPAYTGVIWIGFDNNQATKYRLFAANTAAPIWQKIMQPAHDGLKPTEFKQPNGIVTTSVDYKTGMLPGPNCPPNDIVSDSFANNTVPTQTCDKHVVLEVCTESNQLATTECPKWLRAWRTYLIKPASPNRKGDSVDPEPSPPTQYCTLHQGG